ncbi:hypothetical protein [Clostridium saccharoperbutylacetonicum]|jgi:hypothetical protein
MGKKYIMFVNENGFLTDKDENFTMVGVVFECDYCGDSKYYECELKMKLDEYKNKVFSGGTNVFLDDMILKEEVYRGINKRERTKFASELASLFKDFKFSIVTSTVKRDMSDSYSRAAKKLLKEFYTYVMKKNGQSGGIILEAKDDKSGNQQAFFDIYNDRNENLNILGDVSEKISSFMICDKSNNMFGTGIELLNVLNNILFRVSNGFKEFDSKLISYVEYGNRNKVFDIIKRKIYKDVEIRIGEELSSEKLVNSTTLFNQELKELKDELVFKNIIINKQEEKIEQLTAKVNLLNEQLEAVLFNKESENMMSKILSEINVKIQGFDKMTKVAKN